MAKKSPSQKLRDAVRAVTTRQNQRVRSDRKTIRLRVKDRTDPELPKPEAEIVPHEDYEAQFAMNALKRARDADLVAAHELMLDPRTREQGEQLERAAIARFGAEAPKLRRTLAVRSRQRTASGAREARHALLPSEAATEAAIRGEVLRVRKEHPEITDRAIARYIQTHYAVERHALDRILSSLLPRNVQT